MDLSSDFVNQLQRALDRAAPHDVVPVLAQALEESFGAKETTLLLADYGESSLERFWPADRGERAQSLPVDGSRPGRCYREQETVVGPDGPGWCGYFPVSVRSERFGVLCVVLAAAPDAASSLVLELVAQTLGYVISSARRYTDVFERVRRRRNLALAAEMQWELLPVLGYDSPDFGLAGALEPAYDVAGDNFDYAVEAERLTVSITDAMGHGLRAAMLASLAVNAMRNTRRGGGGLEDQARKAAEVIESQFGGGHFVTGLLMQFDLRTGHGRAVNAGQGLAWRSPPGSTDFEAVELEPDVPLGPFPDAPYRLQEVELRPGERLVMVSDGVLEACRDDPLGADRVMDLLSETRSRSPFECVRAVIDGVAAHQGGDLVDDATVLCLDWHGRQH